MVLECLLNWTDLSSRSAVKRNTWPWPDGDNDYAYLNDTGDFDMRILTLLLSIPAMLVLVACGNGDDVSALEEQPTLVQMAEVRGLDAQNSYSFPAKVVPKTTVEMSFRVPGRLQAVNLPEGQYVKKGQVIAKLDPEPFDRAVRMAEVRLKQAKLELDRVKTIATKGIGSEKSVDNAQVGYDLAIIDLENAKANLEYSVLKAPFEGLVAKRLIENEGFIGTGKAIARLQDLSKIHFEFDVSERLVSSYRRQSIEKATAYIGGIVDKSFDIKYVEHTTEPDPVSQTYQVVYAMKKPKGMLITPGVRATINIVGSTSTPGNIVGVPVNAVVTNSDNTLHVWVVTEESRLKKQTVTVGPMKNGWVAVLTGLESGQKVVSAGTKSMKEGLLVRPYEMK